MLEAWASECIITLNEKYATQYRRLFFDILFESIYILYGRVAITCSTEPVMRPSFRRSSPGRGSCLTT